MIERAWHERPNTVLLDTAKTDRENRRSLLFTEPVEVLQIFRPSRLPVLLEQLEDRVKHGFYAAGYVHYECGRAFEEIGDPLAEPDAAPDTPVAWFGVYDTPREVDFHHLANEESAESSAVTIENARFSLDRSAYGQRFERIIDHIREGDVYQINFTGHVRFEYSGAPIALYRRLRNNQRVPYGAFLHTDHHTILCLSPELFFRRRRDHVVTRPMKGTIRRGKTLAEDLRLRRSLRQDEKSRAENLMIVDLLRNDLSRIARPNSVQVPTLFSTEVYDTVTQMTSTVEARLREEVTYRDLFRALFPCGSVIGAPKIRAMQIIDQLESEPRGIYCGSIGYLSPEEEAVFNVAIRTVVLDDSRGTMGAGSGIVWDSDPDLEYEECTLKAQFLTQTPPSFHLIESIRWNEEYKFFHRHLNRLECSAQYFGFPFSRPSVERALSAYENNLEPGKVYKIRLCLYEKGRYEITGSEIESSTTDAWRMRFADERIDPDNRYRYHKTSRRDRFDKLYEKAVDDGFDEIVFMNTRGEITEGSRSNIFIREGERFFTPPLRCGLLPGVYRSHLLDTLPNVEEKVLHPSDLHSADEVYLSNAVRGMQRAQLSDDVFKSANIRG